ncbi:MAG: hypothetical protein Q4B17_04665 [Lautropia sp.]|nr:hypothetical protein [Lautropia sp.]
MPLLNIRTPLTAAALALLLAACGGGGGSSDRAVSSSPDAPGSATNPPATGGGTGSTAGGGTGAGSGGAQGGSPQVGPTAPRPANGPISANGISGALLATLLDQQAINPAAGPGVPNYAKPTRTLGGDDIDNSPGPFITSGQQTEPSFYAPPTATNNPYALPTYRPASGTFTVLHGTGVQNRWNLSSNATIPFVEQVTRATVTIENDTVTLDPSLSIELRTVSFPGGVYQATTPITNTYTATQRYQVRFDELVPFGQVLQQWQNPQATGAIGSIQLLVQRGEEPDEVQLCWNTGLTGIKRLFCREYEVPARWTRGQTVKRERYVIADDRSVLSGESGFRFWEADEDDLP